MRQTAPYLLVLLVASSGCSHYGWADRGGASGEETVAVRTVDVDASRGVDADALTRQLVADLRAAGIGGAAWRSPFDPSGRALSAVDCRLSFRDEAGFGSAFRVRATARCSVYHGGRVESLERSTTTQATTGTEDVTLSLRRTRQMAATGALQAVAVAMSRSLSSHETR